jgi:hypothetical protein
MIILIIVLGLLVLEAEHLYILYLFSKNKGRVEKSWCIVYSRFEGLVW